MNGFGPVAAILICMIPGGLAHAQADGQQGTRAAPAAALPTWVVSCSNANREGVFQCGMEQTLFMSASGQRLLAMKLVRNPSDREQIVATLSLPHGILLDAGVTFWVDDGPRSVATISHADGSGSYATFPFDQNLSEAFRRGRVFRVSAQTLNSEEFVVDLSLDGFSATQDIMMRGF